MRAADVTITFAALKPGLRFEPGRTLAGVVEVADIGIAVDVHDLGEPAELGFDQPTRSTARSVRVAAGRCAQCSGSAGQMVVGGSGGMTGAPMLATAGLA